MGKIVYRREQYAIQEVYSGTKKGYILFNMDKPFAQGHSHLNNLGSAQYLIRLMISEKLPNDLDSYRLESICRVASDSEYAEKAKNLLAVKKGKTKQVFFNPHKKLKVASC